MTSVFRSIIVGRKASVIGFGFYTRATVLMDVNGSKIGRRQMSEAGASSRREWR